MERKRLLICVLLPVCAVVLVVGLYFLYQAQFIKLDMSFASSAVIEYRGQDGASVTLTPEETDKLKSCFTGNMKKQAPSGCGFGSYTIRFIGDGQEAVFFPGGDGCGSVAVGSNGKYDENGAFFSVGSEEAEYMTTLITQYGAQLEAET